MVAGMYGVPAIQKEDTPTYYQNAQSTPNYTGLLYSELCCFVYNIRWIMQNYFIRMKLLMSISHFFYSQTVSLIAGGTSFIFSALSLFVMSACPKFLIQISLLFSLIFSAFIAITSFIYGNIVGGIFGIIFLLISVCYACCVWKRIPFAAANLNTGLTAVKSNAGVILVAYGITACMFGYAMLWMVALVGVYDKEGLCDTTTTYSGSTSTDCSGNLVWGYFFLLLLAIFWSQQVFQNTIHVVIAGVVSTWWFVPEDASSCCSPAIGGSFVRATTTSFGSICFGSLLVAIIQTLRAMVESARSDSDNGSCGQAFFLCIIDCLLRCIEDILEYFNKFAYIYVGMVSYYAAACVYF